jgi:ABC-type glycerol-3-phosphate transport system substrate-binding protein
VFAGIRGDDPRQKTRGRITMAIRLTRLAVALGLIALGAVPARAQSLDDLYAKAKSEGAFVLYVGGPTAPWEAMAKMFNQRYPGITVSISGGFSNVLDKKIDAQIVASKLEVDAAILQTIADFVRWKDTGRLVNFKPAGFDKIDASFKDPAGAYWATMVPPKRGPDAATCRRRPVTSRFSPTRSSTTIAPS